MPSDPVHSRADMLLLMPVRSRNPVPKRRLDAAQRTEIVRLYERGEAFGPKLAQMFGVHRNTIYAILKRGGAVRGCRAYEAIAPLIAELDERKRKERRARQAEDELWLKRANEMMWPIHELMRALLRADREGSLAQLGHDMRGGA